MKKTLAAALLLTLLVPTANARAESGRQVVIETEVPHEPYMWTMTKDAFFGALFGALVGGGVLLLSGGQTDPSVVAYTTGGGLLLGSGFGLWEIADRRAQVRGPSALAPRGPGPALVFAFPF